MGWKVDDGGGRCRNSSLRKRTVHRLSPVSTRDRLRGRRAGKVLFRCRRFVWLSSLYLATPQLILISKRCRASPSLAGAQLTTAAER
jgi:hypothetical protein